MPFRFFKRFPLSSGHVFYLNRHPKKTFFSPCFRNNSTIPNSSLDYNTQVPWNTIIKFVPHQEAWVIEKFGKFSRILHPGLQFLYPLIETIKFVHSLKEVVVEIPSQSAITMDNVSLDIDGLLYYRIVDAYRASYHIDRPHYAISQLAMTTLRSEIGQLTLDRTLAERTQLNTKIVSAINMASKDWGIHCLRYEIREMHLPSSVRQSMHSQVAAERSKRAVILESEGQRQSAIYLAQGQRQAKILQSEAVATEILNQAKAEAESILIKANANATKLSIMAKAMQGNASAVNLQVAETWLQSWEQLNKSGNTIVLQAPVGDPVSMITTGSMLWKKLNGSSSLGNPFEVESSSTLASTSPKSISDSKIENS
ncbi:hypothetical protein HMI54_009211 [Coelomomyces lativittatus]|nr:hypothetical protein HMI56_000082 [Coelomomyces lativittatus]KAJ1516495.1 hypothetical protein HMI54_009211 [Coelomomyces lativittatus]KAJ1517733.1 hypothetical protein HMI55_006181 [Coelomomyces lativittatus]